MFLQDDASAELRKEVYRNIINSGLHRSTVKTLILPCPYVIEWTNLQCSTRCTISRKPTSKYHLNGWSRKMNLLTLWLYWKDGGLKDSSGPSLLLRNGKLPSWGKVFRSLSSFYQYFLGERMDQPSWTNGFRKFIKSSQVDQIWIGVNSYHPI